MRMRTANISGADLAGRTKINPVLTWKVWQRALRHAPKDQKGKQGVSKERQQKSEDLCFLQARLDQKEVLYT